MAKILLVSSSFESISLISASEKNRMGVKIPSNSHYPLGIAFLHSSLESKDHLVKSLFLNSYSYDDCFNSVTETIKSFDPDIVGFQILTSNRVSTYYLIEHIHKNNPEIKIAIGGIHSTIMYRQLLKKFPYIIAILGEGEITFAELAEKWFQANADLNEIDGIAFYKGDTLVTTKMRKLIENLDDLPFPNHDIFFEDGKRTSACLLTTRGCPFSCSFCCLDVISRKKVRKRSIANIIAEIEMLLSKFPKIKDIWIHDDTFFIDNERVIELCDEVIKRKLKVAFTCSGRMKPLSEKMIKKLEQANFKKVLLGLESGDEGILKTSHKMITQTDVVNAFTLFSKSKISILAFLIVGLPGENMKTILKTARLIKRVQKIKYVYYNDVSVLAVYPGTEIYEIAKKKGMIDDNYWLTNKPNPIFTVEHSEEKLLYFKGVLLKHISLDRFFTPAGFIAQFFMIPYIIKYLMANKNIVKVLGSRKLKEILPAKIFNLIKKISSFFI
ncbi:MAG: radical SAM protein [Deltaproteobacteria bacterium]